MFIGPWWGCIVTQLVETVCYKPGCSVIGVFHCNNPSFCTMALGLTQPLSDMFTSNFSWGVKVAGAYG